MEFEIARDEEGLQRAPSAPPATSQAQPRRRRNGRSDRTDGVPVKQRFIKESRQLQALVLASPITHDTT